MVTSVYNRIRRLTQWAGNAVVGRQNSQLLTTLVDFHESDSIPLTHFVRAFPSEVKYRWIDGVWDWISSFTNTPTTFLMIFFYRPPCWTPRNPVVSLSIKHDPPWPSPPGGQEDDEGTFLTAPSTYKGHLVGLTLIKHWWRVSTLRRAGQQIYILCRIIEVCLSDIYHSRRILTYILWEDPDIVCRGWFPSKIFSSSQEYSNKVLAVNINLAISNLLNLNQPTCISKLYILDNDLEVENLHCFCWPS